MKKYDKSRTENIEKIGNRRKKQDKSRIETVHVATQKVILWHLLSISLHLWNHGDSSLHSLVSTLLFSDRLL